MMKYFSTLLLVVAFCHFSYSQTSDRIKVMKISSSDSVLLDKAFNQLIEAIEKKNVPTIRSLSLSQINCAVCIFDYHNEPPADYIVPIDTFINQSSKIILETPLETAIHNRGYNATLRLIRNYKSRNLPLDYPKDLKIYELWIQTYLPNELAKGHEGGSHGFQFVKVGEQFKFYGLTSVP
ncbi:MAG: hypothetical protein J7604_07945 [Sporocytophaga sp.]|uniref:hypothetical protein n=1 Tax=Sporocytophaga sp. TaxID=2231183 RepID=UPI001B26EC36|nr:hypothetical protein [Sporocytophaga sp.]MBO9700129.1 hypothetical protein [Sporocytophaga sp.]